MLINYDYSLLGIRECF